MKSTGNSSQEQRIPLDEAVPHFSKNIVWTFEDIRMLIGTDLPIFGGKTHPCLTLRLRYHLVTVYDPFPFLMHICLLFFSEI